jgi:putative salt-induced outer membrane protein YdiY
MLALRRLSAAALAVLLLPAGLAAQQEAPTRPWTLETDFGFVNTAGNTATTTLNAGQKATYTTNGWTLAQSFAAVYGRTEGATSAESYQARLRGDRALSSRIGVYILGGWDRNAFAGISRRFEESTGLSFEAIARNRTTLTFEAGVAANQQRTTLDRDLNFASGRGAALLKQFLGEKAYLTQVAEVLPNLKDSDDLRINSETALVAPLSAQLAFKAGYVVRYDKAPEPGFGTTDRYLTSGLQIVF